MKEIIIIIIVGFIFLNGFLWMANEELYEQSSEARVCVREWEKVEGKDYWTRINKITCFTVKNKIQINPYEYE